MAYNLDQFIADCRATLKRDPGPAGREIVRAKLEALLREKDFVEDLKPFIEKRYRVHGDRASVP